MRTSSLILLSPCKRRSAAQRTVLFVLLIMTGFPALSQESLPSLELSRPVRTWEFLSATGTRAALYGNEAGRLEAWVYPLKILRDFRLRFHSQGVDFPAEALVRTLTVRPESTTITYASDTFTVRETLFVPVHEAGAVILLDVDTAEPVDIEADFQRDFQLEWPGALAATFMRWDQDLHAFVFAEELKTYVALVGSPTAENTASEFWTNYAASEQSSFHLGAISKGHQTKLIVIAASTKGNDEAVATYRRLSTSYDALLKESAKYYRDYLARTVNLALPDKQLQSAYDWSRISMIQGLVENPYLGSSLVAGYRTSGNGQRPGFAWFFGRDALWTSLALNATGDFTTTRTALDFLSKYQREDGKIPHEVSQSASLVPWFKDYPYGYASADATPLFIIALDDYVTQSGDLEYAKQKWNTAWKAYEFLRSTYDAQGLPQNFGFGHGWIEGGPLLPVKSELYQSGVGLEALRALSHLAQVTGKKDVSEDLSRQFDHQKALVNQTFWSPEQKAFTYAIDKDNKRLDSVSVLATVPMWFGGLDEAKSESTIDQLAAGDQQTDWGMRIISNRNPHYGPAGYHFGSVWPLFTGWAAVGEYRYHRTLPAYSNLRSNALLSEDGSLGHVTEVLSGDFNQPLLTSSPQQIWSAAMVVSPILRGLFGLEIDAAAARLTFAPHVPANWTSFHIENVHAGSTAVDLAYSRTADAISLDVSRTGPGAAVDFSPAISLRAKVLGAEIDGRRVPFHVETNSVDQHVRVQVPKGKGESQLRIQLRNDFDLGYEQQLPALGASSHGLRVISQTWTPQRDQLTLQVAGVGGEAYELTIWNPSQILSVDGARMVADNVGSRARIEFSASESSRDIVFHFKQ